MRYRRADVAGGTYFFTVDLLDRQQSLLVEYVNVLREVVRNVKSAHPFHIDAMVILPDHLHALWTLPAGECDYPDALDADQIRFLAATAPGRAAHRQPSRKRRARYLATAVLGAPDPR